MSHKKVTIWLWTSECVCCVKVGLISGQPPRFLLLPPSIYLGGHTCLLVRVWMRVGGWQLHSFMDLTCTSWGDAKDGFEERTVTFTKSECLTYYADEKTVSCASNHTCSRVGIIAQNHTRENGELRPFSSRCVFGVAAHVGRNSWNPCVRNTGWPTAHNPPVPDLSLSTRTAGRQRLAVEQNLIA